MRSENVCAIPSKCERYDQQSVLRFTESNPARLLGVSRLADAWKLDTRRGLVDRLLSSSVATERLGNEDLIEQGITCKVRS